jgi:transposase-like protein
MKGDYGMTQSRKEYWMRHKPLLEKLYFEEGMTQGEIAREYGVSTSTIARAMRILGIEVPNGKRPVDWATARARMEYMDAKLAEMDKTLEELDL